jgi:peptide/nickel transport system substrate-binding protein
VHLNPHFAGGTKDQDASAHLLRAAGRLGHRRQPDPGLAAEIPSAPTAASADGKSVTWKLKKGVTWHDGKPFTADDVVFTGPTPATRRTMVTVATYKDIKVEKIDSHTVRVDLPQAHAVLGRGLRQRRHAILPKHVFEPFIGAKSRENPANLKPVGTGPVQVRRLQAGRHRCAPRPTPTTTCPTSRFFDALEIKGGGDATSAARAVLQTGEYDFAWNLAVEDEILKRLEAAGKGKMAVLPGSDIEFVSLNVTDPWNEVDGERGQRQEQAPGLQRQGGARGDGLLVDRKGVQDFIYGRGASPPPTS